MEKLIKYLNQFEEEKAKYWNQYCNWQYIWGRPICTTSYDMNRIVQFSDLLIISKVYEFIKWLFDKDKIDFDKLKPLTWVTEIMLATNCPNRIEAKRRYRLYEQLLMLLSISDNPISDLISYLK